MSSIKDFELAQRIYIATHELKTRIAELERERDALAKDAEQSGTMLQWILSNAEYRLGVNSLGKPNYYVVPAEVIDAAREKP